MFMTSVFVIIAVVMTTCVQCMCMLCPFLHITLYLKSYHMLFLHIQLGGRNKKKLRHPKASEPQPPDPELDRKMAELEKMTDAQINEKLQAMLVSCVVFLVTSSITS